MKQKEIWECSKCGIRIKGLYENMPKPQKCHICENTDFKIVRVLQILNKNLIL